MFAAVLEPAHRRSAVPRQPRQCHLLAAEQALVAEAAAHVGRDHTHGTVLEVQAFGHAALHDMRHLGSADNGEISQPVIPIGDDAASFHREHAMARGADFARDFDGGGFCDALDRPVGEEFDEDVVTPFLVHQRRVRSPCRQHVDDRLHFLVIDKHAAGDVLRLCS
jgi:hypothetical protein